MSKRLLEGQVHATFVPPGALGMTIFAFDQFGVTRHAVPMTPTGELIGKGQISSGRYGNSRMELAPRPVRAGATAGPGPIRISEAKKLA